MGSLNESAMCRCRNRSSLLPQPTPGLGADRWSHVRGTGHSSLLEESLSSPASPRLIQHLEGSGESVLGDKDQGGGSEGRSWA